MEPGFTTKTSFISNELLEQIKVTLTMFQAFSLMSFSSSVYCLARGGAFLKNYPFIFKTAVSIIELNVDQSHDSLF